MLSIVLLNYRREITMAKTAAKKESKTPAAAAQPKAEPGFRMVTQYVKDMSFECPKGPFAANGESPEVTLDIGVSPQKVADNMYEVVISLRGRAQTKKDQKLVYLAELAYSGLIEVNNVPEEQLAALLMIDGAMLTYPFARQTLMTMVINGGFNPPALEPINFMALFEQNQQRAAAAAKASPADGVN